MDYGRCSAGNPLRNRASHPDCREEHMSLEINEETYDVEPEQLRLLVERDSPASWIAQRLLEATDGDSTGNISVRMDGSESTDQAA